MKDNISGLSQGFVATGAVFYFPIQMPMAGLGTEAGSIWNSRKG